MKSLTLAAPRAPFDAAALLAAYCVALVTFPADFGLRLLGFVLSPSRAILAALIVVLLIGRRLSLGSLRDLPRPVLIGWILFLGSAAVSTLVHPAPTAVARFGSLVVEGSVLFWVVTVVVESLSDVRRIVVALVLATVGIAVATLILGLFGYTYDGLFAGISGSTANGGSRFGIVRQQASFPAPLFFGMWLAGASPLVLPYLERGARSIRIAFAAGWILLFSAVALLSVSRMAIIACLAVAGAYFLMQRPRWLGVLAVVASIVVATGFASLTAGVPSDDLPPNGLASPAPGSSGGQLPQPTLTDEELLAASNRLRIEALEGAVQAVSQRPLFGWGLLTEKEVVSQIGGKTNFVDSSYLALLVDLGLVGFAAFLFLLLAIGYACIGARRFADGISLGLASAALLAMSGLAAFLVITQGYALTWVLAALLLRVAMPVGPRAAAASGTETQAS